MTRRSHIRKFRATHYWVAVLSRLWCWKGGHDTGRGKWMRYLKDDPFKRGSCEDCLRLEGVERPQRKVTMNNAVEDVRARQAGNDE